MRKVCNVAVGTVWSAPDKTREVDAKALTHPADIQQWLLGLSLDEKLSFSEELSIDTQILYGEEVEVLEEQDEWTKVACIHQASEQHELGYPGYIPSSQLSDPLKIDEDSRYARVIVPKTLSYKDSAPHIVLSFNTTLPVISDSEEFVTVMSPDGPLKLRTADVVIQQNYWPDIQHDFKQLYNTARQSIDLGYLWGGMSSYGYDCSGFVYQMYRHMGHKLPRDAHEQYAVTHPVEKDELMPGDLVYFSSNQSIDSISHIGIYIGDGMMIHSPHTPKAIEEMTINSGYYETIYVAGSRVIDFQ
ncbi:C40 family peptidase [Macrococcus lamae]|uniref:NlpC/P60 family protein n=1 Tax=Macrococcus lamae TaxID=198484 RepID=A0A4R6BTP6_9STAP|nr:C40 family peptidase [Macrococcus lamae]TDM10465.1 NlpC/P60 family protein [Macrococcus lamae]